METDQTPDKVAAIAPQALTLAEAVVRRAERLQILKDVRNHQRSESAENLAVAQGAYRASKQWMRTALAVYDHARSKVMSGKPPPPLDETIREKLRMYGWNV